MKTAWPKISKVKKNGRLVWLVDARIDGKGERLYFQTRVEAETAAEQKRASRKNEGVVAATFPAKLRIEAAECERRLNAVGATLTDATDFYLRHAKPAGGERSVSEIVGEFLTAKEQAGRRAEYLRVQRSVLSRFAAAFDGSRAHEIGTPQIESWLQSQGWTLRTRSNVQNDLRNLYGFAERRGYVASNPVVRLEKVTLDEKPPGILTVTQAVKLLNTAAGELDGAMLPFCAIGLFAGLRASELRALDWKEVSVGERTIEVLSHKAKTRQRRIVAMSENLAAWLRGCAKHEGPVVPDNFAELWEQVRERAGVMPWPKNALRHSFASYHVAFHRNAPMTSLEMGHDNPEQLFQNYRELVKPKDAERFWKITPSDGASEKIVEMARS